MGMGWRITSICSKLLIVCKSIDSWVDMTPYFQLPWQIIFQRGIEKIFFYTASKKQTNKQQQQKKTACEIESNNNCKNNTNKVKAAQLWPTLYDPMNYTVQGILQVRILEWVDYPFSSGSSLPRNRTGVSCIAGRFFTNWTIRGSPSVQFSSVQFSRSVVSDSLWPHESQHTRPHCPSLTPRVYSNSCPLSRWCHPAI